MTSKKLGTVFMALGAALILGALALLLYNRNQARQAELSVEEILPQVQAAAAQTEASEAQTETSLSPLPEAESSVNEAGEADADKDMTVVEIDGYGYIGYLSIPVLDLELPVMSEWDYPKLKIAPCRYTGSTVTDNLVICGHNYTRHFGLLKALQTGDSVLFTDMDGTVSRYQVQTVEVLQPTAIQEMIDSDYDLTLFTCTYGGATRVTVRCDRVTETTER